MERVSRGDVWIVEPAGFPKPRPALVVSINAINDLCPDIIVVPITTKPGPLRVPLALPSSKTGLTKKSFAKCEAVGPLHKSRLKKRIGALNRRELRPFEGGVRRVLGLDRSD